MHKVLPDGAILIPDTAQRVFKGQIFDVYQWPQKMFDGREETFEMLRRPDTVQVIGIKDGRVVLIQDHQPHKGKRLGLPGGRTDDTDESWLDAAKRELLEETGLTFKQWKLVHVEQPQPKIEWFGVVFLAWDFENEQAVQHDQGGEQIEVELVDFVAAKEVMMHKRTLGYMRPLFEKANSVEDMLSLPEFRGHETDR